MKKSSKVISLLLAVLMAFSCFTGLTLFSASAADTTKIYFQVPDPTQPGLESWGTANSVFCHVYHIYGEGNSLVTPAWGAKKEKCTYDKTTGIATYDIDAKLGAGLAEGCDYAVLFFTKDTTGAEHQTGNVTLSNECYGGTIYVTGNLTENTEDSSKMDFEARWTDPVLNEKYGPRLGITSTGKVINDYIPVHQPRPQVVSQAIRSWAVKNASHYTAEKVQEICTIIGVEPIDVYNQYANDYASDLAAGTDATLASLETVAYLLGIDGDEEPSSDEPSSEEPSSEEPSSEEPSSEEPSSEAPSSSTGEDVYLVAGTENLTGYSWVGDPNVATENVMNKMGNMYMRTFANVGPIDVFEFKIVKNGSEWIGDETGNNFKFKNTSTGNVQITYNPVSGAVTCTGKYVEKISELSIDAMRAVGNGSDAWLNGVAWDPANDLNLMTEVSDKVYQLTMNDVEAFDNYEVKFAANGSWADNWGIADGTTVEFGVPMNATYNKNNIKLPFSAEDTGVYDITLTLDLNGFDYSTKTGGTITIDATPVEASSDAPSSEEPSSEEPSSEEPSSEDPSSEEPSSEEPSSEEPSSDVYVVAGTEAFTGYFWIGDPGVATENVMVKDGDVYTITYEDVEPMDGVEFKIVKNKTDWIGSTGNANFSFNVVEPCDITITYNPATGEVTYTGTGVEEIVDIDIEAMYIVGNGDETWLNGANWDPAADDNMMTKVGDGVYQYVAEGVEAFSNYQFKFAANGEWTHSWGVNADTEVLFNKEIEAVYNGNDATVPFNEGQEGFYTLTFTIDISAYNNITKTGAIFKIDIEEGSEPSDDTSDTVDPIQPGHFYVVAGSEELCGSAWDPSDRNNEMTYNEAKGVYEIVYEDVAIGTYEFKVTTDGAWDNGDYNLTGDAMFGGPNAICDVEADGSTVIIGFDGTKALLEIYGPGEAPSTDEPSSDEPSSDEPSSDEPSSDEPADDAFFTVYATSNIAPTAVAKYNEGIDKVTVTYKFSSTKNIQSLQWAMTYDSSVLALASNVNKRTVCPTIGDAVVNFDVPGEIYFNVSNLNLYDFSSEEADNILVTVTFDVIGASEAVSETTVNLDVEVLQLSLLDENFEVIVEEEVTLVADHVLDRNAAANVNAQTSAEFAPTDFDYVPGTDEPSSDEPSSDEPSSDEPSSDEPSSDAPSTDAPSSDDTTVPAPSTDDADSSVDDSTLAPSTSDSVDGDNGTVQTGEATLAIIMLLVLASATAFLYFTRKRTV